MKARHQARTHIGRGARRGQLGTEIDHMKEEITDWLRDTYAMERGVQTSLEKHADNDELSEEVRARARTHLEETRGHAEQVKAVLQSLGTDTSTMKTGMGIMGQGIKGITSRFAKDERIKDLLDSYMMEHFEIACYTALSAAAERAGMPQVIDICERILPDEERTAQAILSSLPAEVTRYLYEAEEV